MFSYRISRGSHGRSGGNANNRFSRGRGRGSGRGGGVPDWQMENDIWGAKENQTERDREDKLPDVHSTIFHSKFGDISIYTFASPRFPKDGVKSPSVHLRNKVTWARLAEYGAEVMASNCREMEDVYFWPDLEFGLPDLCPTKFYVTSLQMKRIGTSPFDFENREKSEDEPVMHIDPDGGSETVFTPRSPGSVLLHKGVVFDGIILRFIDETVKVPKDAVSKDELSVALHYRYVPMLSVFESLENGCLEFLGDFMFKEAIFVPVESFHSRGVAQVHETLYVHKAHPLRPDPRNILISRFAEFKQKPGIPCVVLKNMATWCELAKYGHEMLVTTTGIEMFPKLEYKLTNMKPDRRYKVTFQLKQHGIGPMSFSTETKTWNIYFDHVHNFANNFSKDVLTCIVTGEECMKNGITSDNILVYAINKKKEQVSYDTGNNMIGVRAHYRQFPVLSVYELDESGKVVNPLGPCMYFYPETTFVAVTEYHGPVIKNIKERMLAGESEKSNDPSTSEIVPTSSLYMEKINLDD